MFGGRAPKRADSHPYAEYSNARSLEGERRSKNTFGKIIVYGLIILFFGMAIYGIVLHTFFDAKPDPVGIDLNHLYNNQTSESTSEP